MAILLARGGKNIPAEVQRWQYFLLRKNFPQVGVVDADFGIKTELATKFFQTANGLKATGRLDAATHDLAVKQGYRDVGVQYYDERSGTDWPKPPSFTSPGNKDRNKHFKCFTFIQLKETARPDRESIVIKGACDGSTKDWTESNIVDIEIPQLQFASGYHGRFRCHALVAGAVKALFKKWEDEDLLHLLLSYEGAFVPRYVRGTPLAKSGHGPKQSSDVSSLSNHAFGTAFDVNASLNPRVASPPPPEVTQKGSVRLLVPAANELGFFWGGHYRAPTKFDGMHFEFADFSKL